MIIIDKEKCTGCGLCASDCFGYNLFLKQGKMEVRGDCFACGHCVALCPVNAIRMDDCPQEELEACTGEFSSVSSKQLLHTIKCRRSIRHYRKRTVPMELMTEILQAGRFTPTAGNAQDVHYTVIQEKLPQLIPLVFEGIREGARKWYNRKPDNPYTNTLNRIYEKYKKGKDNLFFEAPLLLLISAESSIDGILAAGNIELMANTAGLGCLYSGFIELGLKNSSEAIALTGIQAEKLCCCLVMGYPAITYKRSVPRRKLKVEWM